MNTQPEALLCAEMLEVARDNPTWADYSEIPKEACRRSAAELRRLHELALEQQGKIYALEMARSMEQKTAKLKQDALLEALKEAAEALEIAADNAGNFYQYTKEARAAIKMAEEGK